MLLEGRTILYLVWIVTIASAVFFIPRNKVRLAWVAFLFTQLITWPVGLLIVDIGLIKFPTEFLQNASHTSLTFEYLVFPAICAFFNVYFPEGRSPLIRLAFYSFFCTAITALELFALNYTDLIRYIHWNAYLTWGSLFLTFYFCRKFCVWFFNPYGGA